MATTTTTTTTTTMSTTAAGGQESRAWESCGSVSGSVCGVECRE